jgi:hypothetical protein
MPLDRACFEADDWARIAPLREVLGQVASTLHAMEQRSSSPSIDAALDYVEV